MLESNADAYNSLRSLTIRNRVHIDQKTIDRLIHLETVLITFRPTPFKTQAKSVISIPVGTRIDFSKFHDLRSLSLHL